MYVALFNVIVTACPSSTPTVVTVTVPSESSSVAFNTSPQLNALVAIAFIVGTVVSITKASLSANDPASPGVANVSVALFPPTSWIVPPFNANAVVDA